MPNPRLLCTSAALVFVAGTAAAQDTSAFLNAARHAAAAFRDRSAAIAAGYRPVGPESPAMGRHWVHPGLILASTVDPARPAILAYATVAGDRVELVGIAYALPAGATIPDGPAPRDAWHVHDGTVMSEAVQPDHDAHRAGATVPAGVAVLHAWVLVPNPAGTFASNNWALPFVTAGLAPPAAASTAAAQALSLGRHATAIRNWLASRAPGPVTPAELDWLEGLWAR